MMPGVADLQLLGLQEPVGAQTDPPAHRDSSRASLAPGNGTRVRLWGSELGYSPRGAAGADELTCAGGQGTGEVLLSPSTWGAHRELLVPPSSPALGWGWCPPWFVAHLNSGSNLKAGS